MSARRSRGIVLVVVLLFALLLATTVATFSRKALIDQMVVRNRDARAQAEAMARGGVRLATALILEDALRAGEGEVLDHAREPWAQLALQPVSFEDGSELQIRIEDAAARLNLNAAIAFDDAGNVEEQSQQLLIALLEKAVAELDLPPGSRAVYDPVALALNLIDYVDEDDQSLRGGPEDAAYQERDPPTRPANRPLLSVDELRRVEGFDGHLVEVLRPYVTVFPYVGGGGINPNTAPPHVLTLLFFNDGVDLRLAPEDTLREILLLRRDEGLICGEAESDEACTPMTELVTNAIFPAPSYSSEVFQVTARARVGDIQRSVEAVIDRSEPATPRMLSWRVQ